MMPPSKPGWVPCSGRLPFASPSHSWRTSRTIAGRSTISGERLPHRMRRYEARRSWQLATQSIALLDDNVRSQLQRFGKLQRVIHFHAKIADHAFQLGMAKQELARRQVTRLAVEH